MHLQAKYKFTHIHPFHAHTNLLKSNEEIEEEALEEAVFPNKCMRFVKRCTFLSEFLVFLQGILLIVKCLSRLNEEIGILDEVDKMHPFYWLSILISWVYCIVVSVGLEHVCVRLSCIGNFRRRQQGGDDTNEDWPSVSSAFVSTNSLYTSSNRDEEDLGEQTNEDNAFDTNDEGNLSNVVGGGNHENHDSNNDNEKITTSSDCKDGAHYKTGWKDLLSIIYPDCHLLLTAMVFLILAAIAQVLIPHFTGKILDAIATYTNGASQHDDPDDDQNRSIWNVPDFVPNMRNLVIASILGSVFSGVRGFIFTIVGARVNVRLRTLLMNSLLIQDIGFFDMTKTGDISSRLSSDTTLVGDQLTMNINYFLRSVMEIFGVLIYMTALSWQLTMLAFISVPVVAMTSQWYSAYVRSITKLMQKKLAEGNSISEASLCAMATVRAFGAEAVEMLEFQKFMSQYQRLNRKNAAAYFVYATGVISLPQLVTAIVLFYGGLLVITDGNNHITSGQLVSFLLYLASLTNSFLSFGWIFSSLTRAVGAADKVFELIHRKPERKSATRIDNESTTTNTSIIFDTKKIEEKHKIEHFRTAGVKPTQCLGEVIFDKVVMHYPARPQQKVLNEMNLHIPSGTVAALVGPSGGGKSTVFSIIQNFYDTQSGNALIDGINVNDLSPDWLSENVAVVSQEPTLFARSIKRNIIYGLEGTSREPTMHEIEAAAKLANAHEFIEKLPLKYDTDVGERGIKLSGGQKQRIAIARGKLFSSLLQKCLLLLHSDAKMILNYTCSFGSQAKNFAARYVNTQRLLLLIFHLRLKD